ncbi:hypothetical protein J6590_053618 [Homalodisca vitripennis]|nr:hypothetical protein J6590_053618 [Homalodisca vitripennis]
MNDHVEHRNVEWCPDIVTLGAVPNLEVDDRYTKPRWSERLSIRGKGHSQHPTHRVFHLLLYPRTQIGIPITEDRRSGKTAVNHWPITFFKRTPPASHPQGSSLTS